MNKIRPVGKWVFVVSHLGGERTTESGILYNEVMTTANIWATVVAVGDSLTEDIRVGDKVLWDRTKNRGQGYENYDAVHQDWIALVERK